MNDDKEKNGIPIAAVSAFLAEDFENFLVAATPGGIEAQEAQGQEDFVASNSLPKECPQGELESLGFAFGDDVDDIFVDVLFPPGWKVETTDHSMWSDLLDNKDRIRGSIFYKAAFYDRSAHMQLARYLTIKRSYKGDSDYKKSEIRWKIVSAEGVTIHEQVATGMSENDSDYYQVDDLCYNRLTEWLSDKYPEFEDPLWGWDWE